MTQNPGQWGPQGGYPPQPGGQGQGGFPPQGSPGQGGYPPQQGPGQGGYPPQPGQGGYPPQQPPPGYAQPAPGGYSPQGAYAPQGGQPGYPPQGGQPGYPPQGGGYGPQGPPGGGFPPQGGPPAKKGRGLIIGIVVAAVVLLMAIGGIIIALNRGGGDDPGPVSITPSQPAPPTDQPTEQPTDRPTEQPTDNPTSEEPTPGPTETSEPPSGNAIDLGNGISLTPADGWSVKKTGKGVAQLSDGKNIFLGQSIKVEPSTNAGQLCTSWHKSITEGTSGGKFQEPKDVNLGTSKLKAATCLGQTTVSSGQGSATIFLFSLVSVRASDGVTVIGTVYFTQAANAEQLNKDFATMINSMLKGQVQGG